MRLKLYRVAPLLAIPLTVGACSVIAYFEKPNLLHRLVEHPVWCMGIGVLIGIVIIAALLLLFTLNEDDQGRQVNEAAFDLMADELQHPGRYRRYGNRFF